MGSAAAARRALETLSWTLDPEESWLLALLATELIANSVQHANTAAGGDVQLEANITNELVRVRVMDAGHGFVAPFRTDASPLDSHWGLHLLDLLADRWEVTGAPSTTVSFEVDRLRRSTNAPYDAGRLSRAIAEHGRLDDEYERAIGTSSEFASYQRLRSAAREVAESHAELNSAPPASPLHPDST